MFLERVEKEEEARSLSLCFSRRASRYRSCVYTGKLICRVARLAREAPPFPDYRFPIARNSIKILTLLPVIRNSRNCRVPSGNTIFTFLLSFSEPEEPDHDDERLGGTSEYHALLYIIYIIAETFPSIRKNSEKINSSSIRKSNFYDSTENSSTSKFFLRHD